MSSHITYFSFLRGIAILMVIGIHTYPKHLTSIDSDISNIIIRLSLNCAVPIFLALSSFFIAKKPLSNKIEIHSFLKRQIPKVYLPCIIWSIPLYIISLLNSNNSIIETIKLLICGYSIYYFVALIIQFYLLTSILTKFGKTSLIISSFISIASVTLYVYSGLKLPLILYAGPFWIWLIFYMQGIFLSRTQRNYSLLIPILLLVASILLQLYEFKCLYTVKGTGLGIKGSAFIYSIIVIYILFSQKIEHWYEKTKNPIKSNIEFLGKISFGIYLIHCYIITILDKLYYIDNWFFKWILTLFTSIFVIKLIKIIIPSKISSKYLGFYD